MKPGRFLCAALCLLSALIITTLPVNADTSADNSYQSAVWVAETDGVLKLAASDGSVLFEVGSSESIDALALDEKRGLLWTYGSGTLSAYTFDGTLNSRHQYKTSPSQAGKTLLKVSSIDGSVWLVSDNTLFHYTSTDGLLSSIGHKGITGVSVSPQSSTVWLSDKRSVYQVNETNNTLQLNSVFDTDASIQAIQYDEYLQELWIATSRRLLRIDQSGRLVSEVPLSRLERLASDSRGGLWATVEHKAYRIDASGLVEIDLTLPQPRGGGKITAMVADKSDGTLWVANRKSIIHLGRSGEVLQEIQQGKSNAGIRALAVYHDIIPPELTIATPENGAYINSKTPTIELEYSDIGMGVDGESLQWFVDGDKAVADCDADEEGASCTLAEPLNEGYRTLAAQVRDYADNVSEKTSMTFTIDTIPPEITVSSPGNGFYTNQSALTITGAVNEPATLTINDEAVPLGLENEFSYRAALIEGHNTYTLIATDLAGNATTRQITGDLDTTPPLPAVSDLITVTIDEDQVTVAGAAGSVEPGAWVTVTNATTGESVTVKANADGSFSAGLPISPGDNLITKVSDRAGNNAHTEVTITTGTPESGTGYVPPDPASIAPPIDPTVLTTVYNATTFLYSGNNPIQFGVAQGTIEERRVAVLRGKVTTRGGAPLSGVTITVKGHDEFGWTGTREDGAFDLVTNGGGILTVNYRKKGYLPVQRQIDAPWQDYVWLPDVVMIPLDDKVTTIDLASDIPMQVAQGSPVTDEDGTRQATILFPQGTRADMVLPDGARQPLTTLNVRATEYTVGDEGPNTMPGVLPPTSGYTYAVELSVDEAIENGAKEVRFSQPVPFYVDNFIGFPVGGIVPAGWYDRDKAAWVPSDNGRVIEILDINGDLAELDIDGSGSPADVAALEALGITGDERRRLAGLYEPGDSLWRTPVEHFTPWDCNWPYGPPDDAEPPPSEEPETGDKDKPDDPTEGGAERYYYNCGGHRHPGL